MHSVDDKTRLKNITLLGLPKLKQIWSRDTQSSVPFQSLQVVYVKDCGDLEFLFPFSIANHPSLLEAITIINAEKMKEIVSKREEPLDNPVKFEFNQLTSMVLWDLRNLQGFFAGNHSLSCSSLKELNVCNCEKLKLFKTQGTSSQGRLWDYNLHVSMQQPLFTLEEVSQNLEELSLNENDTMRILNGNYGKHLFQSIKILRLQHFQETPTKFLNDLIQMFPTTTTLQARYSSFKTLFPSKEIGHCSIESPIQIKTLWLFQLQQLEHIWSDDDSVSHPLVQNLEDLYIGECPRIIRLAPPSASFEKLTSLEVKDCNGLMYLMTSSTAKSLLHLTSLKVSNCGMLEEVVMTNEGESEEEITFESLKYLELNSLSGFKSFCSGKHTFIFPSLVTLEMIGCHKMQYFSSGAIIAPFLKLVEVENEKKHWKEDLNTTIKQLFIDQAIGERLKGDYKESSSINIQSDQKHQKSASTSRALSSKEHGVESKVNEIVDLGKQQMHNLPIPHTAIDTQKICEIAETSVVQASQSTINLTKVDAVIEIQEMHETIGGDFVQDAQNTLSCAIIQDAGIGTGEMNETIQTSFAEAEKLHSDIRNQEMDKTLEKASVPVAQNVLSSSMVDNIALQNQEMDEIMISVERPLVQSTKIALSTTTVYDADGLQDLQLHLSENLLVQTTTSIINDDEENTETTEMHEPIQRPLVPQTEDMLITASVQDKAIDPTPSQALKAPSSSTTPIASVLLATGTREIHETMDKSLIQIDQDAEKHATTQNKASETPVTHESIDKPLVQATQDAWDITIVQRKAARTQETYESKRSFSIHNAQNVSSPTMVYDTAIDPASLEASKATSSSTTPISEVCRSFKELNISEQLLPYLEAGAKRHPQVLDWLNTKPRRVLASSSFSLFAEVTCILRSTQRRHLTKDDRNHIRECCSMLQVVGFDASWLNYVYKCIEECDDGEDIKRKIEETKGQASSLRAQIESMKKELASKEESLVLLLDKDSRLDDFIES